MASCGNAGAAPELVLLNIGKAVEGLGLGAVGGFCTDGGPLGGGAFPAGTLVEISVVVIGGPGGTLGGASFPLGWTGANGWAFGRGSLLLGVLGAPGGGPFGGGTVLTDLCGGVGFPIGWPIVPGGGGLGLGGGGAPAFLGGAGGAGGRWCVPETAGGGGGFGGASGRFSGETFSSFS